MLASTYLECYTRLGQVRCAITRGGASCFYNFTALSSLLRIALPLAPWHDFYFVYLLHRLSPSMLSSPA